MESYSVTDEVQELEFPKDSFRAAELQMSMYAQSLEVLSEAATRAGESFQKLREEVTVPGIYKRPNQVWVEPTYKQNRAKLKKQKRKRGGPR